MDLGTGLYWVIFLSVRLKFFVRSFGNQDFQAAVVKLFFLVLHKKSDFNHYLSEFMGILKFVVFLDHN